MDVGIWQRSASLHNFLFIKSCALSLTYEPWEEKAIIFNGDGLCIVPSMLLCRIDHFRIPFDEGNLSILLDTNCSS